MSSTVKDMLDTYPADLGEVDRERLTACIEQCIACAQACTTCADPCRSCEQACNELLGALG